MNKSTDWRNHFSALDAADREDPFSVIEMFCGLQHIYDIRNDIHDLFACSMASEDWRQDTPRDKTNRMWRMKQMIRIIEAVYLINQLIETEKLHYSVKES